MADNACKNLVFSSSATVYGDPAKALKELGWKAERDLSVMCEDAWRWQSINPNGFNKK